MKSIKFVWASALIMGSVLASAAVSAETFRHTITGEDLKVPETSLPEGRDTEAAKHFLESGVNLYTEVQGCLPKGEEIYLTACSGCHGHFGEGKLGPGLADAQYHTLMGVFAEMGVRAVVATNTLAAPAPSNPTLQAGVGGGRLHAAALAAAKSLIAARDAHGYPVDVVGCGGILDGASCEAFARLGVRVFQYWSALVYRGPLAGAIIQRERDSSRIGSYGTVT